MNRFLRIAVSVFLWCVLIYSGVMFWNIGKEYVVGTKTYDNTACQYVSTESTSPVTIPLIQDSIEPADEEIAEPTEKVWEEYAPIGVDFEALLKDNSDVVGWLYSENTVINYPIVQGPDNNYYLDKLLDKSYNICGSLFLDYQNNPDFSHYQNIIYGHKMNNGSMFGTIPNYKKQEYYEEHPHMYLLTPDQDYKIVLIAGYVLSSNDNAYLNAESMLERDALIQQALEKSTFQADVDILDSDRLLSMSTCVRDYQNARYMLMGVLREIGPHQFAVEIVESSE